MDKSYKTWDYNLEEDNLEDGALVLEQLENALIDIDDCSKMPLPSTAMVPLTRTLVTTIGASCPIPLPLSPTSDPLPPQGDSLGNHGGAKRKAK